MSNPGIRSTNSSRGLALRPKSGDIEDTRNPKNREVVASAAARGVSFIVGRIFGQKLENLDFCVVFVNKMMFRALVFNSFLFFFLVRFCGHIPNTMLFVFDFC